MEETNNSLYIEKKSSSLPFQIVPALSAQESPTCAPIRHLLCVRPRNTDRLWTESCSDGPPPPPPPLFFFFLSYIYFFSFSFYFYFFILFLSFFLSDFFLLPPVPRKHREAVDGESCTDSFSFLPPSAPEERSDRQLHRPGLPRARVR